MTKRIKQVDLLLLERSKRSGPVCKLRARRFLSFVRKHGADCIIAVSSYAAFVYVLGWVVPLGIGILIVVIAWASASDEDPRRARRKG